MTLDELNHLNDSAAVDCFLQCCSASRWADAMAAGRPYRLAEDVLLCAEDTWRNMQYQDYMEAFDGHPKIGDPASLKEKYRSTLDTASNEQSAVNTASDQVLNDLAEYNQLYEKRFGYIFIVCATGKSALEMLGIIRSRMANSDETELAIAAAEQAKITAIRIGKMLEDD